MNPIIDHEKLLEMAESAREGAYAPYSHFTVGAALLGASGKVYTGCNIENMSYSATVCAERTALFKAISESEKDFVAIAISGAPEGEKGAFCAPCGICRQVLSEFCAKDFLVILGTAEKCKTYTLGELLPLTFALPD